VTTDSPPRAQLIHIDVDRRLGHEWDEWDGQPLPGQGNFDSAPLLFFGWSAAALGTALGAAAGVLYLLAPRLALLAPAIPQVLWITLGTAAGLFWLWWLLLLLSFQFRTPLLPERLAERGPFLRLMRLTSRVADRFGMQDAIWRGTYYTPGGGQQSGGYGHYDHVHVTTLGGGYATGREVFLK